MKVLVIGAGNMASAFVRQLSRAGHQVSVTARSTAKAAALAAVNPGSTAVAAGHAAAGVDAIVLATGHADAVDALNGGSERAKQTARALAESLGFETVDAGGLKNARYLESLAGLNIYLGDGAGLGTAIAPTWLHRA